MIVLVTHGGLKYQERVRTTPERFGFLVTPRCACPLAACPGAVVGVDNDRFNACYSESAFVRAVENVLPYAERVRFVTAPDVVCDGAATLREFAHWEPRLRPYGLPLALALQNGMTSSSIPWAALQAVFVGGDDEFKDSLATAGLIREAQRRGKWVHVGRCNTVRRFQWFGALGVDSIDGSGFARFQDSQIDIYERHTRATQLSLL